MEQQFDKKALRRRILGLRDSLTESERKRGDILVSEKILGHQWYYSARHILLFASYGSEISTEILLEESLRCNKRVYLPRVEGKKLCFYRIFGQADLTPGFKGILEPLGNTESYPALPELEQETLMIMPGAVFDVRRNRLGYGGGFYDRYLADKPWMRTIAIGYRCQMVESLPQEEWDIRPGQVICF